MSFLKFECLFLLEDFYYPNLYICCANKTFFFTKTRHRFLKLWTCLSLNQLSDHSMGKVSNWTTWILICSVHHLNFSTGTNNRHCLLVNVTMTEFLKKSFFFFKYCTVREHFLLSSILKR